MIQPKTAIDKKLLQNQSDLFNVLKFLKLTQGTYAGDLQVSMVVVAHNVLKPLNILLCTLSVQKKKKKGHRFTNNLQGLQKVMLKDFS